ncbi:MAG: hypothetical protein R2774_13030 [Saprospiraceae bacterium]
MKYYFIFGFMIFSLLFGGCKKEDDVVKGCKDSAADNYVANADEEDGSCTYQKRYLGSYLADIACQDVFKDAFSQGNMAINETIDKTSVNIILETNIGPLPVTGKVSRDTLAVDAVLSDIEIELALLNPAFGEGTVLTDISLKSKMVVSSDNKNLNGPLEALIVTKEDVVVFGIPISKGFNVSDSCSISAVKL